MHDDSASIHHGGATHAHYASTIRYGASTVQAESAPVEPRPPPRTVFVMNRGESGQIGVSVIPRFTRTPKNDHKYIYGATMNKPDSATVKLRFRPRPQSTTIRSEFFKWFKIVVALSLRFPNHQDSSGITTVQLSQAPVTLSRFKPRFTTTHPDLRQMVKSGCIGMRRDGKKEIPASIRCLTMLLRCLHDSSTDPLRLMTAALRFTTVELRMLTMPPRFDTVLVLFKPVALR